MLYCTVLFLDLFIAFKILSLNFIFNLINLCLILSILDLDLILLAYNILRIIAVLPCTLFQRCHKAAQLSGQVESRRGEVRVTISAAGF